MLLFGKKEATWPPEDPQSNMVIKSLGSWRQSICPLRFQSPTIRDTKKGAQKRQKGAKQLMRQLLSLQSCPTLCDPIDGSPSGSSVPGILQARTLEQVAISFSNA